MSISKPSTLGIIACPGGERFADEIIRNLRGIYRKKYDKMAMVLAEKYSVSKQDAIRIMNLEADLHAVRVHASAQPDRISPPPFKLPVRFTRFANGEFKSEIQSSIRGMDIYIVQDVENSYPLVFNDSEESHSLSVNDHIFVLFTAIDAALQAGAVSITLVMPAYPFSRQHKKKGQGSPQCFYVRQNGGAFGSRAHYHPGYPFQRDRKQLSSSQARKPSCFLPDHPSIEECNRSKI